MTDKSHVAVRQNWPEMPTTKGEVSSNVLCPVADIFETPQAFVVMLDMPGAKKESVSLSLHGGSMVVKADVPPHHGDHAALLFTEIVTSGYYRSFKIGEGIDGEHIDAHYDVGVLTVKLYKSEKTRPREIQIR